MPTRTIILTPPGHPNCKISQGPWQVKNPELADISSVPGQSARWLVKNSEHYVICYASMPDARYIAACMSDVPAWELAARLVFNDTNEFGDCVLKIDEKDYWVRRVDGYVSEKISPLKTQVKALAWLLQAGCAKEVSSE